MTPLSAVEEALVRCRTFNRRASATPTQYDRYEVFCLDASGYMTAPSLKRAQKEARTMAERQPGVKVSIWSPVRAHVHQSVVNDGQYIVLYPRTAPTQTINLSIGEKQ